MTKVENDKLLLLRYYLATTRFSETDTQKSNTNNSNVSLLHLETNNLEEARGC